MYAIEQAMGIIRIHCMRSCFVQKKTHGNTEIFNLDTSTDILGACMCCIAQ